METGVRMSPSSSMAAHLVRRCAGEGFPRAHHIRPIKIVRSPCNYMYICHIHDLARQVIGSILSDPVGFRSEKLNEAA